MSARSKKSAAPYKTPSSASDPLFKTSSSTISSKASSSSYKTPSSTKTASPSSVSSYKVPTIGSLKTSLAVKVEHSLIKLFETKFKPLIEKGDIQEVKRKLDQVKLLDKEKLYLVKMIHGHLCKLDKLDGLLELDHPLLSPFASALWFRKYEWAIYLLENTDVDVNNAYNPYSFEGVYDWTPVTFKTSAYITNWVLYVKRDDETDRIKLNVIKLLLEKGADPNVYDVDEKTIPLRNAIYLCNVPAIKLLLKYGAKYDFDNPPVSCLHTCATVIAQEWRSFMRPSVNSLISKEKHQKNLTDMTRILNDILHTKARDYINYIDTSSRYSTTALHILSGTKYTKVIKMLLRAGADPLVRSWEAGKPGVTSLEIAQKRGRLETVALFEAHLKKQSAAQTFDIMSKVRVSPNTLLPDDIAVIIAQKTANMSKRQSKLFDRATNVLRTAKNK